MKHFVACQLPWLCRLTIRVLLGGNLEKRREGCLIPIDGGPYPLRDLASAPASSPATHMLVDKEDSNVLAILGVLLECGLDGRGLRLWSSARIGKMGAL